MGPAAPDPVPLGRSRPSATVVLVAGAL